MDQPTSLDITIRGKSIDVKRAALAAQRRIDLDTRGFKKEKYIFGDGLDFEEKIKDTVYGDYSLNENENGTAKYQTEQTSWACIYREDIKEIADDIVKTSPDVELHMTAVITMTYEEGYDLCLDVDYVNGEMHTNVSKKYYEDFDEEYEDFDEE